MNKKSNEETLPVAADISTDELAEMVRLQGDVVAEQQDEINRLKKQVEDLPATIGKTGRKPAGSVTFQHDGQTYEVLYGVQIPEGDTLRLVTAEDIRRESGLQQYLIENNSGAIRQV
jgi:hypothetical protein